MTKDEALFQRAVRDAGCIACYVSGMGHRGGDIHHLLSGGRRIGEMAVICLCPSHHRGGLGSGDFISRHPWLARFEKAYGKEAVLLEKTKRLVAKI